MLEGITRAIGKIFGSKKDKDVKLLTPYVYQVQDEYDGLSKLSDDQLRAKSDEFRKRISDHVAELKKEIEAIKEEAESMDDVQKTEELYKEIDELKKERNQQYEAVLADLLPEAFAVIKETARRLSENKELRVKATEWDRELAATRNHILIDGDTAIWKNSWDAAGAEIVWNMVHYDVQIMGGVALHQGKIAEMATGEGKTLVSTFPVYLNALTGEGVHVVTVNNYLARRDCEWNAPLFQFHGISVDCIDNHEPNSDSRRDAYKADVTYGTNNEFGFDYLRDNMTTHVEHLVQREPHYAIIDEIDSVLIDEARTPLIISGPVPRGDIHEFDQWKPRIEKLIRVQRKLCTDCLTEAKKLFSDEGNKEAQTQAGTLLFRSFRGLPQNTALIKYLSEEGVRTKLQKAEGYYLADKGRNLHIVDDELYFTIDEKNNTIELTDKGRDLLTNTGEDPNLFVMPDVGQELHDIDRNPELSDEEKLKAKDELASDFAEKSERLHTINQLVKAYTLFEKDVDYIVQDDKVMIVDEQTGRVLPGRRYSEGLHQAIEAKENVKVEAATQTFATVTLQNYFRMYHKLAGMTGTAETEAAEFYEIYKLDVVVVPTNKPIVRADEEDLVYKTKREKYNAVIDEILKLTEAGRPVLVGTTSVEVSELLSRMLKMRKIRHNVLNAKQHQREAEVVAEAGQAGTVTIATNMAGRGTDIKLGPGVIDAGGLAIIGTERHESRRIDRQLRGRAGRQGDPGYSQFFVSLEDDLMRLFGSERISKIMDRLGLKEGEVIQHPMITKSISNAQKKVEENNFGMRKRLLEYDDVMNSQREVIYRRRRNALFGDRIKVDLDNMLADLVQMIVANNYHQLDVEGLQFDTLRLLAMDPQVTDKELEELREEEVVHKIYEEARRVYARKMKRLAEVTHAGIARIREKHKDYKMVDIAFSAGSKRVRVVVDIDETLETEGGIVPKTLEKNVVLGIIDDKWKTHLREMDELRQSVQNAVFEQKDPLLVYKFESFKLFQQMLDEVNKDVISVLFKAEIEVPKDNVKQVKEPTRDDFSNMKTRHDEVARQRAAEKAVLRAGSGGQQEQPMTRAQRRAQERSTGKKRRK